MKACRALWCFEIHCEHQLVSFKMTGILNPHGKLRLWLQTGSVLFDCIFCNRVPYECSAMRADDPLGWSSPCCREQEVKADWLSGWKKEKQQTLVSDSSCCSLSVCLLPLQAVTALLEMSEIKGGFPGVHSLLNIGKICSFLMVLSFFATLHSNLYIKCTDWTYKS